MRRTTPAGWAKRFSIFPKDASTGLMLRRIPCLKKQAFPWFLLPTICIAGGSVATFFLCNAMKLEDALADKNDFYSLATESHVSSAFDNFYKNPYPHGESRYLHDIRHVSRVAYYIQVLYDLYQKNGLTSEVLTKEQIKLLEVAAIFHDAGRKQDGKDLWDKESAELFYHYCVFQMHLKPETVKVFAEAIMNKDYQPDRLHTSPFESTYWKMVITNGLISWKPVYDSAHPKTLIQKLLHDADCIDIQRIEGISFVSNYMDICHDGLDWELLDKLSEEVKSLINMHGDIWDENSVFIAPDAYRLTKNLVANNKEQFPVFIGQSIRSISSEK